ncbi:MAG: hypothetical protein GX883_04765 [Firmicutes bacterium]|nr:hypothetical protein [Bacillota bacterium]
MDNEINLKELLLILWRGKYLIVGITILLTLAMIFYVYFMITPAYRYSAVLDLTLFGLKSKEVLTLTEQDEVIAEAVQGLVDTPDELIQAIDVSALNSNESMLTITVEYTDPDICISSAKQTGLAILEVVSEYKAEQMSLEKERSEHMLAYLDEIVEEYLLTRDVQIKDLLEEDPIYKRILQEKADCLMGLKILDFRLSELAEKPVLDAELWVNSLEDNAQPVTVDKKSYIAVAFLFGLMLSVSIVYIRHYFATHFVSNNQENSS